MTVVTYQHKQRYQAELEQRSTQLQVLLLVVTRQQFNDVNASDGNKINLLSASRMTSKVPGRAGNFQLQVITTLLIPVMLISIPIPMMLIVVIAVRMTTDCYCRHLART